MTGKLVTNQKEKNMSRNTYICVMFPYISSYQKFLRNNMSCTCYGLFRLPLVLYSFPVDYWSFFHLFLEGSLFQFSFSFFVLPFLLTFYPGLSHHIAYSLWGLPMSSLLVHWDYTADYGHAILMFYLSFYGDKTRDPAISSFTTSISHLHLAFKQSFWLLLYDLFLIISISF